MEKKIDVDKKVRVFISSICGREKYDAIRERLKNLIESTGFASVYLFEGSQASTFYAEQSYLRELDDSDVCIFLIDNADGVLSGVMREYQRAKAKAKKSLFIFCDEKEKNQTAIQEEITGADGAKYYITQSFDAFVEIGYESLLTDMSNIYINYCKGRLFDSEFEQASGSIEEIDTVASESLDKQIFKHIDHTKKVMLNEIFNGSDSKVENTCDFDMYSSEFLKVIFNQKTIKDVNTMMLLTSLKSMQSDALHKVVVERWHAIQFYYMDDIKKTVEYEKAALNSARENQLPNWVIQDILLDLRNLYAIEAQSKNQFLIDSEAQKELDSEKSALFYPLLDRYERSLYNEMTNQSEKTLMRSPYSVYFGNNLNKYGGLVSNIYIMAVFNGSLTHLMRTTDHIKAIAFQLCHQYSDWEFRVLLLKMTLIKGKQKEVKDLINLFNDVYGKMNGEDAKSIYTFVKGNPVKHQRNAAQVLAFHHLGYYFDDDYYVEVWQEISTIIHHWITSEKKVVALGNYIFAAINENRLRLDNNRIVKNILIKVFDSDIKRFYDKALDILSRLDLSQVSEENILRITGLLTEFITDSNRREHLNKLGKTLVSIRIQVPKLSSELDHVIKENMLDFYENKYSLEALKSTQAVSEGHILKYVDIINARNASQGENGRYSGYMDNPYDTIKNIIVADELYLDKEMMNKLVQSSLDTLYAKKQMLEAKVSAMQLITFLRLVSDTAVYDSESLINELIKNQEVISCGAEKLFLDKTSRATVDFNFSMMKLVFNKLSLEEALYLLSPYNDLDVYEKIEALKTINTIFENQKSEQIDEKINLLILQFALGCVNDSNHDVRLYATNTLLHLLSMSNKEPIMKKLLSLMDYDSAYIKSQILNHSEKLQKIDKDSLAFIKEKALVDNHFYIRKKALELG